jgi:hypothetical protein
MTIPHAQGAADSLSLASGEPEILTLLNTGNVVLKCDDGDVKVRLQMGNMAW